MKEMAVHGDKREPKTAPTLAKVKIISKLCSQTLGLKSHIKAPAMEIREAARIDKESTRVMNTPQANKNVNIILKIILSLLTGTRRRIAPSRTTDPKK